MDYALGFDLGTTFTGAAVVRDGRAEVVSLGNHAAVIPSVVFLRDDGEMLVGDAAERRSGREPARTARAFKRRFGDSAPIILDRTPFSADRLMGAVLNNVLADITRRLGGPPATVAVTHPANWGGYKLDLLRQALDAAGVGDAQLVPEPVAAAVQYASTERVEPGDVVAVYDLGGGTFDAAVLRKTADGFDILGRPQGIERLGGIDFDEAVLAHVRGIVGDALQQGDPSDPAVREGLASLREECIAAKEALSADSEATVAIALPHLRTDVRITRSEFEDMIRPMVRETVNALRRAVESSDVPLDQVKVVLLAGGSSRIPLVTELVQRELGRPVVSDAHPKHAVALGAARVATARLGAEAVVPPVPVVAASTAPLIVPPAPPAPTMPPAPPTPTMPPAPPMPLYGQPAPVHATGPSPVPAARRPPWVWVGVGAAAVALAVVAVTVLSGGDDTASPAASTPVPTSTQPATTEPAAPPITTVVVTTTPATTTPATPATVAVATTLSVPTPVGAIAATGPSGWWMAIDPAWTSSDLDIGEAVWFTGGGNGAFQSNVNVFTETVSVAMTMQQYVDVSAAGLASQVPGSVLLSAESEDVLGYPIARIEYTADFGAGPQYSVGYITQVGNIFVTATFSCAPELGAIEGPGVEEYLKTLRPI